MRNHDELTLDKLTESEREEVFAAFAPRRTCGSTTGASAAASRRMLDGDQRRIRMVYSLLFALPGTPVMFYGEEIGMGENLAIEGRQSVRTPMQWTCRQIRRLQRRGTVDPAGGRRVRPVGDQRERPAARPESLLSWIGRLVEQYREAPELAWGGYEVLDGGDDAVLVIRNEGIITLHNFAGRSTSVTLEIEVEDGKVLADLFSEDVVEIADGKAEIDLDDYGCRWFRLSDPETAP